MSPTPDGKLKGMASRKNPASPGDLSELFHRSFRLLRHSWSQRLAPFELTPHQFRALHTLTRNAADPHSAGGMRLKDVAERLRIAARSATEVIDHLEAKGLVARGADPVDRRATLVTLTDAGRELTEQVRTAHRAHTEDYFSRLDAAERAELARILGKLSGPAEHQ
ncbi:MarR family transcriptional regulator [Paeniglutamicibacter gangotriensis]|uniref:MarR family transcriptional regulator n=2 Tax=Paeniglutamicibacter gangotriensis TaxID=254787 RepID=A0A5B0EA38_9MICC|nr:MarR family transcriptional regulator [Paeniglutamicibacter gangotriensis]